jgi:hypothetical protein
MLLLKHKMRKTGIDPVRAGAQAILSRSPYPIGHSRFYCIYTCIYNNKIAFL